MFRCGSRWTAVAVKSTIKKLSAPGPRLSSRRRLSASACSGDARHPFSFE